MHHIRDNFQSLYFSIVHQKYYNLSSHGVQDRSPCPMEMLTKCPLVSHRIILMPHPKQQQAARNCSRKVSDLSVYSGDKQGTTNEWQWNSINNYKTPENGNEGKVHVDGQGNSSPISRKRCIAEFWPKTEEEKCSTRIKETGRFKHLNNQPFGLTKYSPLESKKWAM